MIKVIIIDDEPLAREIIKSYLLEHAEIQVIAECADGFEGLKSIQQHRPDLIFLDIQMPKLTGFEMLELLEELPVVIFSTAYDEFALKAFEMSAADYLLKPYSKSRFSEALLKGIDRYHQRSTQSEREVVQQWRENPETLERIVLRMGAKIIIVSVDKVDMFSAEDDYVGIHTEGKKYLKQMTMKALEDRLPPKAFVRVHRSHIVAVKSIHRLEAYSKDSYLAVLHTGEKVPVSRTGYQALRQALDF
jgi:two-component system, LytTR family, response regulator